MAWNASFHLLYILIVKYLTLALSNYIQGGSNMTGTDLYKHTHKSVPVVFEPPCFMKLRYIYKVPNCNIHKEGIHVV